MLLALMAAVGLAAPDESLARLVTEAKRLQGETAVTRQGLEPFKTALRAWIGSRLPHTDGMQEELRSAGLLLAQDAAPEFGYVSRLEFVRPSEHTGSEAIIAGLAVPCGSDDTVYLAGPQLTELPAHVPAGYFARVAGVHFSPSDEMVLVTRLAVQCTSNWNRLSYVLYRGKSALFEDSHSIWLGDWGYRASLKADEFTIELQDRSIDISQLTRTHILRYHVARPKPVRVDPVAGSPSDFVDEWLSQPWNVMRFRTLPAARNRLVKWHRKLHSDTVMGEFQSVHKCRQRGQTQVAVQFEESLVYFLVRQDAGDRFHMAAAGTRPRPGCTE